MTRIASAYLAAVLTLVGAALPAHAAVVRMHERAHASSPVVTLGDVAEVWDADAALAEELRGVTLAPAPAEGRESWIDHATIRARLLAHGYNLAEIEFSGRSAVRVLSEASAGRRRQTERVRRTAPAPDVAAAPPVAQWRMSRAESVVASVVGERVRQQFPDVGEVRVESRISDADVEALLGAVERIVPQVSQPGDHPQTVVIQCRDAQGAMQEIRVPCRITPLPAVLTVRYTVAKGEIVQAADLEWTQAESVAGAVTRPEDVVGREAVRTLHQGKPIPADDVQQVPLIRTGDLVTLHARRPGVSVRRVMKARSQGVAGELVTLVSLDGRETLSARVIGYHEAETISTGPTATVSDETSQIIFQSDRAGL